MRLGKRKGSSLLAHAVLIGTLASAGAATAQGMAKEGNYDFNACWSGTSNVINFSKAHSAFSYEFLGTTMSNPPGGAFDKQTFRCVGMNSVFEGKVSGSAVCEAVDAQGDKGLSHYVVDGAKVARTFVSGTGKYEGMVLSGTTAGMGPFPVIKAGTFQNCNRQTGTYKMK